MAGTALILPLLAAALLPGGDPAAPPGKCTVCRHDKELLDRNGMSHGPFPFGRTTSDEIQAEMLWMPVWIETKHFRLAADLPDWKIPENERKAYRAELEELQLKWPEIKPKKAVLDPWYRAHLLADRMERAYDQFLDLMGAGEEDFWDEERNRLLDRGPYLGEHDKFEVMIFQERGAYKDYMSRTWGLTYLKPQRWNNVDRRCLWFGLNLQEEDVRHDQHVHNVVRHNLGHNMLDGYLYYAYDLPVWITEGFGHWFERYNDERFNMFDTVEGSFHKARNLTRWAPEVRKIVQRDEAVTFALLLRRMSFAELVYEDHLVVWSKIDFLINYDREKFGRFISALKGRRNAQGLPDSSDLDGAQRDAFRDIYGWSIHQAEDEWKQWVLETYPVK